mgnify:CR=1 FL=1
MARKSNPKLKELMNEYGVNTMTDVHEFVKMLTAETIQEALDGEMEPGAALVTATAPAASPAPRAAIAPAMVAEGSGQEPPPWE